MPYYPCHTLSMCDPFSSSLRDQCARSRGVGGVPNESGCGRPLTWACQRRTRLDAFAAVFPSLPHHLTNKPSITSVLPSHGIPITRYQLQRLKATKRLRLSPSLSLQNASLTPLPPSNSGIPSERARSVRYTVSPFRTRQPWMDPMQIVGALNWATGETVAVKEIQLSNIPKGELGQIMVLRIPLVASALFLTLCHSQRSTCSRISTYGVLLLACHRISDQSQHPNIVKYKGFVKTREYLYIILECVCHPSIRS